MKEKTIYIITPSFNAESTISETIHSVINQPAVCNICYHVQDGGSTDKTMSIVRDIALSIKSKPYLYSHVMFSWHSEYDSGMYDAISKAIDRLHIPPEYFMTWINADDVLSPESLSHVIRVAETFPDILWMGGEPCNHDAQGQKLPQPGLYCHAQYMIQNGLCDGVHVPCLQQEGMFWKKSLFDAAGGLNTSLRLAGDWDLWRRMAVHAPFVKLPWVTGIFRRRDGQLSEDMHGYRTELNRLAPHAVRSNALRHLLGNSQQLTADTVRIDQTGKMERVLISPKWFPRHWVRLWLAAHGFLWMIKFYQRLVGSIRQVWP